MKTLGKLTILLLGICLIFLNLSSCKKDKGPEKYRVSGHLYQDCNLQPIVGETLQLWQESNFFPTGPFQKGGLLGTTTTNENGYFEFEFEDKDGFEYNIISTFGMVSFNYFVNIPKKKDTEGLVIYCSPISNIKVSLNVINPYTAMDTLVVSNFASVSHPLKIHGPFVSGLLYIVKDFHVGEMDYEGIPMSIWYNLNSTPSKEKLFRIREYCDDTVRVTIEI